MSLLFVDSCDHYGDVIDASQAGWEYTASTSSVDTSGGRFGGGALGGSVSADGWKLAIPQQLVDSVIIIQSAYKAVTNVLNSYRIIELTDYQGLSCGLNHTASGQVQGVDDSGVIVSGANSVGGLIVPNQWNYIETKFTLNFLSNKTNA